MRRPDLLSLVTMHKCLHLFGSESNIIGKQRPFMWSPGTALKLYSWSKKIYIFFNTTVTQQKLKLLFEVYIVNKQRFCFSLNIWHVKIHHKTMLNVLLPQKTSVLKHFTCLCLSLFQYFWHILKIYTVNFH